MASSTDNDMPIALRKPKRRASVMFSPEKRRASDTLNVAKTPCTTRSKRVRFSDPGTCGSSTSLTPAFRRSTLATPKQRRPATPARPAIEGNIQFTPFTQILDERCLRSIRRNGLSEELNKYESDKKTKNALQKEIDNKDAELKRLRAELEEAKAQPQTSDDLPLSSQEQVNEVEAELETLRQSFQKAADEGAVSSGIADWSDIPRSSGPGSAGGDTIIIHEDEDADFQPLVGRQPSFIDRALEVEAHTINLDLVAAREAKSTLLGSFRDQSTNTGFGFDFADSPQTQLRFSTSSIPETQTSPNLCHELNKQLRDAINRAEEAEVALTALDIEVTNLGFGNAESDDTTAMVSTISEHFKRARLELERLIPGETSIGFDNPSVLPEILKKTKLMYERLQGREKELRNAKDQHHNLKNNFEKAIIAAEKANDRIKRLETSLDSHAEEMLHVRMRSQQLEHDVAEKEKDVASLSNALNKYRADVSRLETLINEMQHEYEASKADVSNSQTKIEDLEARVSSETTGRRAAEVSAVQRLQRINELETSLATSKRHAADLESRLLMLQQGSASFSEVAATAHAEEIANLNARISSLATALTSANAEVDKLKITKQKLEERVRSEVEQGARAVETLQDQLIRTVMKGNEARKKYVNGAKVRIANWELDDERETSLSSDGFDEMPDARTPSSVRFAEWAEVETIENCRDGQQVELPTNVQDDGAESGSESIPGSIEIERGRGRYKKTPRLVSFDKARRSGQVANTSSEPGRRRYDSGIGMSSDNEFEIYDEEQGGGRGAVVNGMMTPEASSEGDADAALETEMVV